MALNTYSTGTVSVTSGGAVTVAGGIWGGPNVVAGDMVSVDGGAALLLNDVTDATHGQLVGWSGGAVSGKSYVAYKCSSLRFDDVQMAEDAKDIVAALNTEGFYHFVPPGATEPDPSLGDDDQLAFQASTGNLWEKYGGLWSFVGVYKGVNPRGVWSSSTAYVVNDVVSRNGSAYMATAPNTNSQPPSANWMVLGAAGAAATVDVGTTATLASGQAATVTPGGTSNARVLNFGIPEGRGYRATSTSTRGILVASGLTYQTQPGLAYLPGNRIRVSDASNGANFNEGYITDYNATTGAITMDVILTGGAGSSISNWSIGIAGNPGAGDLTSTANLADLPDKAAARANLKVAVSGVLLGTGQNFNTLTTAGTYFLDSGADVNAPVSGKAWYLAVEMYSSGYVLQTATILNLAPPVSYTRSCVNGMWGAWRHAAEGRPYVKRKTNCLPFGSFIRGEDGWAFYKHSTESSFVAFEPDTTDAALGWFSRANVQMDATAASKLLFVAPSRPFPINASKRYRFGFFGKGNSLSASQVEIRIKCYNSNGQLLSTLSVFINVANTSDPITGQYTMFVNATGGAGNNWPVGTVSIVPMVGFVSASAGQALRLQSMFAIAEDEWPAGFLDTIQNYGGGTHEAASDGANLYIISHGYNSLAKFDANLKKIAELTTDDYPHAVVLVGDDLWICTQDGMSLQKISKATFSVTATYSILGGRSGFGLATDGSKLWLGAGTHAQGSCVLSVNLSDGTQTVLSSDVDTGAANLPVEYFNGAVWSINEGNSQVKRINPTGGATVATINCSIGAIYGLGVGGGGGYVFASGETGVVQIDPATNAVVATYPFRKSFRGHSNVCVNGGRAYATTSTGVMVIDYESQTYEELLLDGGIPKWARALPGGEIVVGTYAAPWMHVIAAK